LVLYSLLAVVVMCADVSCRFNQLPQRFAILINLPLALVGGLAQSC